MDLNLKSKVVLVTGGSHGIGLGCAKSFAREGAKVVICARNADKLIAAVSKAKEDGVDLVGFTADVTDDASINALMESIWEKFGALNILINNAGAGSVGSALTQKEEDWQRLIDTNLSGTWRCARAAVPFIKESGGGAITNISSLSGRIAFTTQGAYPVTKAGINALTRILASETAAYGIRVNSVAPGFTKTEMIDKHGSATRLTNMTMLHRIAEVDEIAKIVTFVSSDAASYITGEIIEASGGAFRVRDPEYSWNEL